MLAFAAGADAAGPPRLSGDHSRPSVRSAFGSGVFGRWGVDGLGLPRYRYTLDEERSPAAVQPELAGSRDAWHQLGNDHVVADAFNHGWAQLWSQDRRYEWANHVEAAAGETVNERPAPFETVPSLTVTAAGWAL